MVLRNINFTIYKYFRFDHLLSPTDIIFIYHYNTKLPMMLVKNCNYGILPSSISLKRIPSGVSSASTLENDIIGRSAA